MTRTAAGVHNMSVTIAETEGGPMPNNILAKFRTKIRTEDGATATEYVLLLIGVALLVIFGALFLGNALDDKLSDVGTYVNSKTTP
jgi:Flp pilus assembly pilin Flp